MTMVFLQKKKTLIKKRVGALYFASFLADDINDIHSIDPVQEPRNA